MFAALNNLIENQSSDKVVPETVINNKITILEHLTKVPTSVQADELMEEYKGYGKDLRILTYKMLLDKFNEKYDIESVARGWRAFGVYEHGRIYRTEQSPHL